MKKVLVADDESALRFLITETLRVNEYHIFETDNGTTALELALKNKPDLLILDVKMPGMLGYEVASEYRKAFDTGVIIILTAEDRPDDRSKGFSKGADYYMAKPFNPFDLLCLVEEILGE